MICIKMDFQILPDNIDHSRRIGVPNSGKIDL